MTCSAIAKADSTLIAISVESAFAIAEQVNIAITACFNNEPGGPIMYDMAVSLGHLLYR